MRKQSSYEYITVKQIKKSRPGHPSRKAKTRIYEIRSSDGKIVYGEVRWHLKQYRYVFVSIRLAPTKSADILEDISRFIRMLMKERTEGIA